MKYILDATQFQALNEFSLMTATDQKGIITYANDNACKVSGYSREELIGQNHRILKSENHAPEFYRDIWKTISNGKIWRGVICNRKKDGDLYWVDSSIFPVFSDGKIAGYQSIRYDVTEKYLAEFSQKQAREMSGLLSEYLSDGLVIQDHQSKILFCNDEAIKILAIPREALMGKTSFDADWKIFDPDGNTMLGENFPTEVAKRTGIPQKNKILHIHRRDGSEVWILVNAAKVVDSRIEGGFGTVAVFSDITSRIEKQNREMAKQRLTTVGEIASSIAHDIRNPLTIIQTLFEIQKMQWSSGVISNPEILKKLESNSERIQNALDRILAIIKVMQDNIRDGSKSFPEQVNLSKIAEQLQFVLQQRLSHQSVNFVVEIPNDLVFWGNSIKVTQILTNLVTNAIDAVAKLPEKWIRIMAKVNDAEIEVRVIDSGKGIPKEIRDKMFFPLFSTKSSESGTGMGLSIVRRFMEEQGGKIELDDTASNTCFVLYFPLKKLK